MQRRIGVDAIENGTGFKGLEIKRRKKGNMWPEIWMMRITNPCIVRRLIVKDGQQGLSEDPPKKWEIESGTKVAKSGVWQDK